MELVTPEQMREMDRQTIEEIGVPGIVLMERASLGALDVLSELLPVEPSNARVGFLCGGGNNGGDGLAMARLLSQHGIEPVVVLLSAADGLEGDARVNYDIASELDLDVRDVGDLDPDGTSEVLADLPDCDVWCDAMLGTGLTGDVRGRYVPAIEFLNERDPVLAIDVPSGLNGTNGRVMGACVEATATATFGGVKLGQALYPGRRLCGELHPVEIGIPDRVRDEVGHAAEWLDETWASERTDPRPPVYHKGAAGRLLAVAGSHEKTGAALLTARGALRSGAGLITVGTTETVVERIAPAVHEVMAAEMVAETPDANVDDRLDTFLDDADTVAVGPGLETHQGAERALRAILSSSVEACVFDADALNLLATSIGLFPLRDFARDATAVLTPHPGEMSRLCDCDLDDVLEQPVACAREFATSNDVIVALKMAATVVAAPDGRLAINRSGNPGMATGGTGDVLTGVVAARLADSTGDAFEDVGVAVYAHGAAGDLAAERTGPRGLGATDLAEQLPEVWKRLE
jgi:NAD(P)H-hydrate epimerase